MKKRIILPKFKNEDEERDLWASIDISDYLEKEDLKKVDFPDLRKQELESAYNESMKDIKAGRYNEESIQEHVIRVTD